MAQDDAGTTREIHALPPEEFLDEVHSFEFWFQAVEGYLSGTTWGHGAHTASSPLADADRDRLITLLCNYTVGETAALEGSSGLILIAPNRRAKIFLATQVADEARHVEVFHRRLRDLGVADPEQEVERRASVGVRRLRRRLLELVAGHDWEAAIFAQNVILESLEFAVFHRHAQDADPVTAEVLRLVIKDERRHVGFGENELGRRLASTPRLRERLGGLRRELDHLVFEVLADTGRTIGLDHAEEERLGRTYQDTIARLGLMP